MEKKFNVTGELRKELAKATGEGLGWEPVYKGAPSFAYAVANVLISKDGTLSWDERTDAASIQNVFSRLRELGFAFEDEEIDPDYLCDTLSIEMPLEGFTETALENLDRLIASKAELIKKAIGAIALPVKRTETTLVFPWCPVWNRLRGNKRIYTFHQRPVQSCQGAETGNGKRKGRGE